MQDIFRAGLLNNKVAFITGGGSGINQRVAERYAEQGAAVAVMGRNLEKAQNAAAKIVAEGGRAIGLSGDVRDYAATRAAIAQAHDMFGSLDIVIAGAAGNFVSPILGMSSNAFSAVVDIDLVGTFNTVRAAYEFISKPGGLMIAITAAQAVIPTPMQAHVGAAKAGVELLMKTLAIEWGKAGVRCLGISPGPVAETEGMVRLAPEGESSWDVLLNSIPSGRAATRDEIASLAIFLATGPGSYINGTILRIDGGQSAAGTEAFGAMLSKSVGIV